MFNKNCIFFTIAFFVLLALTVLGSSLFFKYLGTGRLIITSSINKVNVIINDETQTTPIDIKIKKGTYKITAYKEGYQVADYEIKVNGASTAKLEIDLKPDPVADQPPEGAPIP